MHLDLERFTRKHFTSFLARSQGLIQGIISSGRILTLRPFVLVGTPHRGVRAS
jgi:hypothetical protein